MPVNGTMYVRIIFAIILCSHINITITVCVIEVHIQKFFSFRTLNILRSINGNIVIMVNVEVRSTHSNFKVNSISNSSHTVLFLSNTTISFETV